MVCNVAFFLFLKELPNKLEAITELIIQLLEKETNKHVVCRSTYFTHHVFTEAVLNASVTSVHGGSCKTAASFKQSETLNAVYICVYVGGAVGWCYGAEIVHNLAKPS